MTFEVACVKCGSTLYSGFDLRSPNDVLKLLGYKCKKCGVKLTASNFKIVVRKIDGSYS